MALQEFKDALLAHNLLKRVAQTDSHDIPQTSPTSLATPEEAGVTPPKIACGGGCNPPMDPAVEDFANAVLADQVASRVTG